MCSTRILRAAWAAAGDEQEAPPSLAWHKGYVNHPNYITPCPRKTVIEAIEEANGCTEFYTSRGGKYITMQPERALAWANIVYCHLGKAERYTQVSAPDPNRTRHYNPNWARDLARAAEEMEGALDYEGIDLSDASRDRFKYKDGERVVSWHFESGRSEAHLYLLRVHLALKAMLAEWDALCSCIEQWNVTRVAAGLVPITP